MESGVSWKDLPMNKPRRQRQRLKRAEAFAHLIELRRAVDAIGPEFKHVKRTRVLGDMKIAVGSQESVIRIAIDQRGLRVWIRTQ